jgi:DNA uptake protein ComE-like DNA-binding protein
VKSFTAKALYEPQTDIVSPNTAIAGTPEDQPAFAELIVTDSVSAAPAGRLNVRNAQSAQQIAQRGVSQQVAQQIFNGRQGFQSINDMIRLPGVTANDAQAIIDSLAVNNTTRLEGRINLNTASEPVLNSIPNMPPDLASAIASRQATPFNTAGEIATMPGATTAFLGGAADLFTVNSQSFLVRVLGTAGGTSVALTAVINIEGDTPRIVSIREEPFDDMVSRWGWPEEATTEIALGEGA